MTKSSPNRSLLNLERDTVRKKLAYLHNTPVPSNAANTVQVMRMCSAFSTLGYDVVLFAPRNHVHTNFSSDEICEQYGCEKYFPIVPVTVGLGRHFGFALHAGLKAKMLGVDVAFGRCVRSCAVASLLGLPTIFEAHGPKESFSRTGRLAMRVMFQSSLGFKYLVVINQALAEYYIKEFPVLAGRIIVAPSGADDPLDGRDPPEHMNDRPVIGYVGSLHAGKGMELLAQIIPAMPDCEFVIAGGNVDQVAFWEENLRRCSNVRFLGHIPNRDVAPLIATFDVALAPYLPVVTGAGTRFNLARWMSPLKLFEYMAMGKAIVTSDMPAIREVIHKGIHAELSDPQCAADWIETLRILIADPERRDSLGQAARKQFLKRHRWQDRAARVLIDPSLV